jgi:hypothetical protein
MSEEFTEEELDMAEKIDSMWIKLQILNFSANGVAFFILGFAHLLNSNVLIFLGMFCLSLFFGASRILRAQLDTQERQVLDRLQYIP